MMELSDKLLKSALLYTITIVLGVSFIAWSLFIKPVHKKLDAIEIEKKSIGLKKASIENIAAMKGRTLAYEKAVSSAQQLPWLIEESNRMAAESGLTLVSAAPAGASSDDADYKKIGLRIEARGSYHELGQFISMVENSPRFIKVGTVNVTLPTSDDDKQGLHMWITMSIYTWKEGR